MIQTSLFLILVLTSGLSVWPLKQQSISSNIKVITNPYDEKHEIGSLDLNSKHSLNSKLPAATMEKSKNGSGVGFVINTWAFLPATDKGNFKSHFSKKGDYLSVINNFVYS